MITILSAIALWTVFVSLPIAILIGNLIQTRDDDELL